MRNILLPVLLATSALAFASAARANECETTAYAGLYSGYAYQEAGVDLATEPVFQGGVTRACGSWGFDIWNSSELSGEEGFGENGGDETDIAVYYWNSAGPLEFELSAAYWALPQYSKSSDDAVSVYADVSYPLGSETVTVAPFVRYTKVFGLGELPDEAYVAPGARLSVAVNERWTIDVEAARSFDLEYDTAVTYGTIAATRDLGDGWELSLLVQPTENAKTVYGFGFAKTW